MDKSDSLSQISIGNRPLDRDCYSAQRQDTARGAAEFDPTCQTAALGLGFQIESMLQPLDGGKHLVDLWNRSKDHD